MNPALRPTRLAIFGVGANGVRVAKEAAAEGFGHISAWDLDNVKRENAGNGFPFSMIEQPKVSALGLMLKDINPSIDYCAFTDGVAPERFPEIRNILRHHDVGVATFDDSRTLPQFCREMYDVIPLLHSHYRSTTIGDFVASIPKITCCIPCASDVELLQTGRGRDAPAVSFSTIANITTRIAIALCLRGRPEGRPYRYYLGAPICRLILNHVFNPVLPHRWPEIPLYLEHVRVRADKLPSCEYCKGYLKHYKEGFK